MTSIFQNAVKFTRSYWSLKFTAKLIFFVFLLSTKTGQVTQQCSSAVANCHLKTQTWCTEYLKGRFMVRRKLSGVCVSGRIALYLQCPLEI